MCNETVFHRRKNDSGWLSLCRHRISEGRPSVGLGEVLDVGMVEGAEVEGDDGDFIMGVIKSKNTRGRGDEAVPKI